MSFVDCLMNSALPEAKKKALVNEYNTLEKRYTKSMGNIDAAQAAAKKFVEIKEKNLIRKMDNAVKDVIAWDSLNKSLKELSTQFDVDKANSGWGFLGRKLWGNTTGMAVRQTLEDVNTAIAALESRTLRALAESLEKYRSKNAGLVQDTDGFKRVVDELLGKKTDDVDAANDAKAIREVFDVLHKQYENAGGILGKLDNYYPQRHNPKAVKRAGKEQWKREILPLLARERIINPKTGLPYDDTEIDGALDEAYLEISTNGLHEVAQRAEDGKQTFGRGAGVSMRHNSSRFLHFKDADAFHKYNNTYGDGDVNLFDAMMGHISAMTRDIAIMQQLGPNPDGQINRMKLSLIASEAGESAQNQAQGMYDILAGRTTYTGSEPDWHRYTRDLQNVLRSAYLGGAPISAMSDTFFAAATAKYNGLPAMSVMKEYFKYLNPADPADRQIARRNAFVAGAVQGMSLRGARFADDMGGAHRWSTFMANFTHRASGLGIMTDAISSAPVTATHGFFADMAMRGTKWNDLPPEMKEAFRRWDMDENDYQNIISSKPWIEPEHGGDFIRPEDVAVNNLETASKYEMWLQDMAMSSSNEPRLLTRYITTGGFKQGTKRRLAASSVSMFKSFGIQVMLNHTVPALRHASHGRFGRLAVMAAVLPLLGAMSIQSRNVLYGKTLQDMDSGSFWASAMAQGGGFGILGDFMFEDTSRYGNSLLATAAGPVAGFGEDVVRVFLGNLNKALDEDRETTFLKDMTKLTTNTTPMIKLWYTRLFAERLVLDQLNRMADPAYDSRIRRMENKMKKEKGQSFLLGAIKIVGIKYDNTYIKNRRSRGFTGN